MRMIGWKSFWIAIIAGAVCLTLPVTGAMASTYSYYDFTASITTDLNGTVFNINGQFKVDMSSSNNLGGYLVSDVTGTVTDVTSSISYAINGLYSQTVDTQSSTITPDNYLYVGASPYVDTNGIAFVVGSPGNYVFAVYADPWAIDLFTNDGLSFLDSAQGGIDTLTQTPIPGALPLFVSGLSGLGLLGWRRKRRGLAGSVTA
jgi:hypothetical protein